ncbi:MAG TPA: redoxin domain-containing protein [Longimicrobiales bacterium]|nr:redoxin domain-containing protein [Longimicrobiales bacterium]
MHAYRDQYAQIFNGGRNVVLIAISADSQEDLVSWARDDEFPFLLASDEDLEVAHAYGAIHTTGTVANRSLFVVGPDGRIAHRATPFREVDPTAYEELEAWVDEVTPPLEDGEG